MSYEKGNSVRYFVTFDLGEYCSWGWLRSFCLLCSSQW